jgi:hypothetical protein
MDYAPAQQNRIASLVPPADPGPQVVVKPVIGRPVAQPAVPKAGKRLTVVFRITRSDNGAPIANFTAQSNVRVAGRSAGRVEVKLGVPKTAKGKLLRITLTVRADNQPATKAVSYKVR